MVEASLVQAHVPDTTGSRPQPPANSSAQIARECAHTRVSRADLAVPETVAVFLGKAPTILARDLGQGDEVIEHDKPAHPWIALGAFGRFALHTDHRQSQLAVLLEMQMAPATGAHVPALGVLLVGNVVGSPMGSVAFALQQRPLFGAWSPFV